MTEKRTNNLVEIAPSASEVLIFPSIPAYNKRNIEAIRAFEKYWLDYGLQTAEDIHSAIKRGVLLSSYGIGVLETVSKILDEKFSAKDLEEAEIDLSKGLTKLKDYDIRNVALAGQYGLEGSVKLPFLGGITGGNAPMSGTLTETKPSGFNDYKISGNDLEVYMNYLWDTLKASESSLEKGFKENKDDNSFEKWIKSLVQKKELSLSEIVSTNTYLENIRNDCQTVSKIGGIFEKAGLNELYKLSGEEKSAKLKESGFKIMSPFKEKYVSDASIALVPPVFGLVAGTIIDQYVPKPLAYYLEGVTILTALGGMFLLIIASGEYGYIIREQEKVLKRIEKQL